MGLYATETPVEESKPETAAEELKHLREEYQHLRTDTNLAELLRVTSRNFKKLTEVFGYEGKNATLDDWVDYELASVVLNLRLQIESYDWLFKEGHQCSVEAPLRKYVDSLAAEKQRLIDRMSPKAKKMYEL